ncbi:MAG: hypothetical protein HY425_03025 [Candidatus Levybacteria bacterium]|nr:hypothetical protein [Candidatus Levybacteria bacterium]
MGTNSRHIINFSQLYKYDLDEVGKKAHQIGILEHLGVSIPEGFAILCSADLSVSLIKEIHRAYKRLSGLFSEASVNIFTSDRSNKFVIFFDVKGDANLIHKIQTVWTSKTKKPIAIVVQKNIKSKIGGKFVTNDYINNNRNAQFANFAKKIQNYFYFPQEVDYKVYKGKIYVTAIRPLTKISEKKPTAQNRRERKILAKGTSLNPGIITGSVRILRNQDYYQVKNNEIAVIPQLNKLLYSKISKAKAVIVDSELASSYDKMIYRKNIKTPTIMGAKNATHILQNGNIITINGSTGEIYSGGLM